MKIRYDSPFWERMGKLYYIIVLNFLWILFSLPLITIGPSTVALHRCMFSLINGKEMNVFTEFYQSFKTKFVRNMMVGLIVVGFGMLLLSSRNFYYEIAANTSLTIYYFYIFLVFLFALFLVTVFPVLGTFDGTVLELLRISLFLSIKHLPMSILMVVIAYLIIYFCQMLIPLALIGVALIAFINSRIYLKRVANSLVIE
ncbi:Predicted integral membrane protein [Mycobacteroides abscessus subsp. abscessus]|nr:Predicted integral membrane protein [Mycobacteroides abscessus subsp. abscessus]